MSAKKSDVTPCSEPVDGGQLLQDLASWVQAYLFLPVHLTYVIAVWAVLTWFKDHVHFAAILAVMSATHRCGKTTLFDLLSRVVCTPIFSSGFGSTPAAVFRLNEARKPTFLIDEAERLGGQGDIVSLLNNGYRRGGTVLRCREQRGGKWGVDTFDAFGFRALAAIGELWPTLMDRSIVVRMQRCPKDAPVEQFRAGEVQARGEELASRCARFAEDSSESFVEVLADVEFPEILSDRDRDNWGGLFAVAGLAGGEWPRLISEAAATVSSASDHGDDAERLILDLYRVFEAAGFVDGLGSGVIVLKLCSFEESQWEDMGYGRELTTHKLAQMLKPFGVGPRQARGKDGKKIRGYWLSDLQPVFEAYIPEVGQLGQSKEHKASESPTPEPQSGAEPGRQKSNDSSACPTCPDLVGQEADR